MHALAVATLLAAHGLAPGGIDALVDSTGALRGAILTYGIVTFDDDDTPLWVCEEATGEDGIPRGGVALDDGTLIVVAPREGLFVSRDGGCSWESVPAVAGTLVTDVARDPLGRVLFATRDPREDAIVALLDAETLAVQEIARFENAIVDAFASDGERILVATTTVGDGAPALFLVDDGGATPLTSVDRASVPFLGTDGKLVVAVEDVPVPPTINSGLPRWSVSDLGDDGVLLEPPHTTLPSRPRAFLVVDGVRFALTSNGLFMDGPRGTRGSGGRAASYPRCLLIANDEVLVCEEGRSRELIAVDFDGHETRFDTSTVRPRACPEGTRAHDVCPAIWDLIHSSQAIGRELPALDDDDEAPSCAHAHSDEGAPNASLALALLALIRSRRRR